MELRDLRYFVEIAELKSIRKAAASLYLSQPNLTRAMQNLEREMGEPLFVRSNRGVELTTFGEGLYYYAQSILQQVDEIPKMRLESQKYVEAKVGIAVSGIMIEDSLMLRYCQTIKANHAVISVMETSVEALLEQVEAKKADFGVLSVNNIQMVALKKIAELKELELHHIGTGPLYVHVGKKNPLYGREIIELKELLPFTRVKLPEDYFSNMNYILSIDGEIKIMDFKKTITIDNYHSIVSIIKNTDAFIFGNRWQKSELEKGQICSILVKNCTLHRELVWTKSKRLILSDKAKELLELILESYGRETGDA